MANGYKDPWSTQYHGRYITNASADAAAKWNTDASMVGSTGDNMDRGAILMYSNGANQKFGTKVKIENGIVTATVSQIDADHPDNNKMGADDYVMAVVYTYTNGYGETAAITEGFSNNQQFLTGNGGSVDNKNININWETNNNELMLSIPGYGNVNIQIDNNSEVNNVIVEKDSNNNTVITATQMHKPIETTYVNVGAFKSSAKVIPGTYVDVTETIETVVEIPTKYTSFNAFIPAPAYWNNVTNEVLENLLYSQEYMNEYVVFATLGGALQIHSSDESVSLEDAIYHAARTKRNTGVDWFVAQWNGSQYVKLDVSDQINNVTTFSTIETTTITKQVLAEEAHVDGTISYVPTGKIMSRKDMKWAEWIDSEYNTFGTTNLIIRDSNHNVIDLNEVIDSTKSYVIRELKTFILDGSDSFNFEYGMSWIEFANEKALYHPSRDFGIDNQHNYIMSAPFQAICNENNKVDTKFVREPLYGIIEPIEYVHKGLNMTIGAE
jgi:hypothetical protein